MPEAVIGLDVGKLSHWACVATRDGEILLSAPVANREGDLDSLFGRFPDALVVVDQSRNIGALALARARAAGMSAAYLPGLAAHGAARLFAGDAKTDERDAMVIAKTALGIPDALLPVGDPGPTVAAARALAAQRNFLTCENTRNKNRLRSILFQVVENGGGKNGKVEGYQVGGKTATSETLPRGTGRYISSFLGFAPADDPKVLALCIIRNPQGVYYGGLVAAPVVRELFENILPYLDEIGYYEKNETINRN